MITRMNVYIDITTFKQPITDERGPRHGIIGQKHKKWEIFEYHIVSK